MRLTSIVLTGTILSAVMQGGPVQAAVLNVPSQFASISAAVGAASNGDTILLADGTYSGPNNTNLNPGTPITIASVNGTAATFIDCGSSAFIANSNGNALKLQGLTIENGTGITPVGLSGCGCFCFVFDNCINKKNSSKIGTTMLVFVLLF